MSTSKSSKNLPKTRPSQRWLEDPQKHMYHQPRTPDLFQKTITWHLTSSKLGSKVWMHQIRTSPNLSSCRFRGKMATLLSVSASPLYGMYESAYSIWTTFGHLHCLKIFRCVYTKQCNHRQRSLSHGSTLKTRCILARQIILFRQKTLCPVRFLRPKRLSALTGFLIPEHWHDGEVLVIGIPHFSKNLGPTWMVGTNHCQFSRHIPSNSIAWCLMLWWRVQPEYCPCLACI